MVLVVDDAVAVWIWLSRHLATRSGMAALRACSLGRAIVGGERRGARCTASELSCLVQPMKSKGLL